jgi:hypothetical protein
MYSIESVVNNLEHLKFAKMSIDSYNNTNQIHQFLKLFMFT